MLNMLCVSVIVVFIVIVLCENSDSFIFGLFCVMLLYIVGMLFVNCVILLFLCVVVLMMLGKFLYGVCVDSILLYEDMMLMFGLWIVLIVNLLLFLRFVKLCVRFVYDSVLCVGNLFCVLLMCCR